MKAASDATSTPLSTQGYLPYTYAAGRFQTYGRHQRTSAQPGNDPSHSTYDFSSMTPIWLDQSSPQTVEDVITSGYFAAAPGSAETAILTDKHDVARLGLDDVISQIRGRYHLYEQNIYELNQSVCEANNSVFRQEADQGHPADNRQQYSAQKQIQKLYEQQRLERVNLWRDVSRLRLALPENAQQYLAAHRKLDILCDTSDGDDSP